MYSDEMALRQLAMGSDNIELIDGETTSGAVGATLQNVKGNPIAKAQFDINFKTEFQQNNNPIAPSALPSNFQVGLPVPLFGQADFEGGYAQFRKQYPVQGDWKITDIGIVGVGYDSNLTRMSGVQPGDLVVAFDDGATSPQYRAFVRIRCSQVSYGTLLASSNSDTFYMNLIRYTVPTDKLNQFSNQIGLITQSLFGKAANDFVSPESYVKPEQFQPNIADIPIGRQITKESFYCSYINYDCQEINWSVFVKTINKIK